MENEYIKDEHTWIVLQEIKRAYSKANYSEYVQFDYHKICDHYRIPEEDVSSIDVDELCDEATKVLKTLDLSNKNKVVRDIIDKIIIKERSSVEVWGHLTLFNQKLGYEPESRNCWFAECREVYII